ncbi:hypothetical protein COV18_02180 [Candidatus Woesearchaeota archaeon CG10_big_fil_rev_8_21_14_0_10_37_12]|nr:MAG: hypothetical protein COV18_02180 [Candidatus Woesearchaeota archaeon CG10_big_fil_rev_8_21_14_0_10_37_12]
MKKIIVLLILIVLLQSVSAQDFNAYGEQFLAGQPCTQLTKLISIQNTQQYAANYAFSVDGDGSQFVSFSQLSLTLNPGQTGTITAFYNIPCDAELGTYEVEIYVTDGITDKLIQQQLLIGYSDNIQVKISPVTQIITPCSIATYNIELTNPLGFTETYTLEATGHANVHIGQKTLLVLANQTATTQITVAPDDCTAFGAHALELIIESQKTKQAKTHLLDLIVTPTHIPELATGITKIRTDYADSTAELTIQNIGDRETAYTLAVDGVSWVSLATRSITVSPGQTQIIPLSLQPTKVLPAGKYPLTFTATVDETGIQYSKDIVIALGPPTFFEQNPAAGIVLIIVGIIIVIIIVLLAIHVRSDSYKTKKKKRNEAREKKRKLKQQKKEEKLRLKKEKKEAKLRKKRELYLKALERRQREKNRLEKKIRKNVEKEYKTNYHLISRKELIVGESRKIVQTLFALFIFVIVILIFIAARKFLLQNIVAVATGIGVLVILYLAKKLTSFRVIKKKWNLLLKGKTVEFTAWKKGLTALSITAEQPIKRFKAIIKKVKPAIKPSVRYQSFSFRTNIPAEATAVFKIKKSWLRRKHIPETEIKLAKHNTGNWTNIALRRTEDDEKYVHYQATIKSGVYTIYGTPKIPKTKPVKEEKTKNTENQKKPAEEKPVKKEIKQKAEKKVKSKELKVTKIGIGKIVVFLALIVLLIIVLGISISVGSATYLGIGILTLLAIYIIKRITKGKIKQKNWKIFPGEVELSIWNKGLRKLYISGKGIQDLKIVVKKTKSIITPSLNIYQTFTFNLNKPAKTIATISVKKRWLRKNHADYKDLKLARYTPHGFVNLPLRKAGENKRTIQFTVEIKQGMYSIYAPAKVSSKQLAVTSKQPEVRSKKLEFKSKKEVKSKGLVKKKAVKPRNKIKWAIGIIVVLLAIAIFLAPTPQQEITGIPPQTWTQNTIHELNLANYFADPDGDELNYSVTPTQHINIEVQNGIVRFIPEEKWAGEERVQFIATDNQGSKTTSNTVPLQVQRSIIAPHLYKTISGIVVLLVIILIVIIAYFHAKKS